MLRGRVQRNVGRFHFLANPLPKTAARIMNEYDLMAMELVYQFFSSLKNYLAKAVSKVRPQASRDVYSFKPDERRGDLRYVPRRGLINEIKACYY